MSAFTTQGDPRGAGGVPSIGVGMLGYAFMGKAHANAYRTLSYMTWPPPLRPELVAIAGRKEEAVAEAARRYGFTDHVTDWRALVADERIGLFDNSGPNNLHAEPTVAAAEAGKHVICEKPLGRDAAESYETWQRVQATGVTHMCAFNYRFVPAVRLARELVDAGEIGEIRHFRGAYLQDWGDTTEQLWRFDKAAAGSGALGDLGAHVVDLARYLVGEVATVSALTATFLEGREVDDAIEAAIAFECGAVGTIEATRFATGRRNAFRWEINGSKGSIAFDVERLNELQVHMEGSTPSKRARGFRRVLVTETDHPFAEHWWPPGHIIGWEHTFVHELHHLLSAIRDGSEVAPHGATLEDGYRAAEVCDAIVRSSQTGAREAVTYRGWPPRCAGPLRVEQGRQEEQQ
ncbi:MAG TPA: Gfo/Idh/MocA family oxidoreductase [Solirubrobacteraceae bacterium]